MGWACLVDDVVGEHRRLARHHQMRRQAVRHELVRAGVASQQLQPRPAPRRRRRQLLPYLVVHAAIGPRIRPHYLGALSFLLLRGASNSSPRRGPRAGSPCRVGRILERSAVRPAVSAPAPHLFPEQGDRIIPQQHASAPQQRRIASYDIHLSSLWRPPISRRQAPQRVRVIATQLNATSARIITRHAAFHVITSSIAGIVSSHEWPDCWGS